MAHPLDAPAPSPDEEAQHLLAIHEGGEGYPGCLRLVRDQFNSLQTRSQLLLSLAALTLTITGFSGPKIAASGLFARLTMAGGLVLCMCAVVITLLGSLRIRWLTQFVGLPPREALTGMIAWRNSKTANYLLALALLVAGLSCYVAALVAYLIAGDPVHAP